MTRAPRQAVEGLTLIEVMIVLVITALAAAGATIGIGALTRAELRSSAMRVAAAANFAYSRSITTGRTVRVVFDLKQHTIAIEETSGKIALSRIDERAKLDEDESDMGAVDPWESARAKMSETAGPSRGRSSFGPVTDTEGNEIPFYKSQPVGGGVSIIQVVTPHFPKPVTEGRAALYFFPGGRTERALIQLSDDSGTVYTVEIHPLTGKATVHPFPYEPPSLDEGDEVKER
jgi:general secretion pathway protein H